MSTTKQMISKLPIVASTLSALAISLAGCAVEEAADVRADLYRETESKPRSGFDTSGEMLRDTTTGVMIPNDGTRIVCTPEDEVAALWDCRAKHPGLECLIYDCWAIFGAIFYKAKVTLPDDADTSLPPTPTPGGGDGTPHQDSYPQQPYTPYVPYTGGGYTPPSGSSDFCSWIYYCNQPNWGLGTWGPPVSGYVAGSYSDCEAHVGVACAGYGGSCSSL